MSAVRCQVTIEDLETGELYHYLPDCFVTEIPNGFQITRHVDPPKPVAPKRRKPMILDVWHESNPLSPEMLRRHR